MRSILIFAAALVVLGTVMAQIADRIAPAPAQAHAAPPGTIGMLAASDGGRRNLSIARDPRGHFRTDGRIDGQRLTFMVDTGASAVALNESSAARFGLRPSRGDYTTQVSTANGQVKAARARIAMLDIGGLIVRDVDALVLPDEALSENLLGLSYLSRLKRFAYADGRMVLEQ
ncbi:MULTISPECIES: TIGR02281 family clan AA aspartic protease [Rhodopseudomonas]|uniref:TIGR02281 family clan AA aspartic protease n=1 Tax=Rhodopseudomonas TaxID=1073 RepID=UPI000641A724|nr:MULTISPECIES: TIGR02281 family clan AA aspartic protease [Rhodopseudomonas]NEW89955.1 TIGR02281 family clan AA aspartic protease [Rhodopseudomonas sp. WA056]QDL99441.1 TIGR02281 family clan AA aspartic protease [Rhodopseudomonas palustris]